MTTATIFGSFANPVTQPAAAPAPAASVAALFDSFSRDGAPMSEPASDPIHNGNVVTAMSALVVRLRQAWNRWTESNAQSRADARLWDIARSDHRIMGELMHAPMRDDSKPLAVPPAVLSTQTAPVLEVAPTMRQPHQRIAGQGWGRIIEDAYQNRFHQSRHQHA